MALKINGAFALIHSSFIIGGRVVEGITKWEHKIERPKEDNLAANGEPYSRSRKGKKRSGTCGLYYREVMNICDSVKADDLTDVPPFDAVYLMTSADGEVYKLTYKDVEFTEDVLTQEIDGNDTIVESPIIFSGLKRVKIS